MIQAPEALLLHCWTMTLLVRIHRSPSTNALITVRTIYTSASRMVCLLFPRPFIQRCLTWLLGDTCLCGNSFSKNPTPTTTAYIACSGDSTQDCGGANALEVYDVASLVSSSLIITSTVGPSSNMTMTSSSTSASPSATIVRSIAGYTFNGVLSESGNYSSPFNDGPSESNVPMSAAVCVSFCSTYQHFALQAGIESTLFRPTQCIADTS